MLNKTPIEETFRNAFDNFEADVNARVWTNIEQHLATPASPVAGEAAKTILTGGKFSALTYGIASSVIIAIVAVSYFFISPSTKETPIANTVKAPQTKLTDENSISSSLNNLTAETKHENTLSSPKTDRKKVEQVVENTTSTEQDLQNRQNVSKDINDNNAATTQPITSNERRDIGSVVDKPVQKESPKEHKAPPTADGTHESKNPEEGTNSNQEPQVEKQAQIDDFEWGIIDNVFTPNNDGFNDTFAINTPGLKSIFVMIYDRNGREVYEWKNLDGSWEGKDLKGNEMPVGTYIYYIFGQFPEGKYHSKHGTISIRR